MRKVVLVSIIASFALSNSLLAQEHHQDNENHQNEGHDEIKHHSLALEFGYTHIPDGFEEVKGDQVIWVPTFGLAYVYHFNHKWAAGLTVNMETGNYLIEFNREDLERENVLIITAVATYEILPNWGVFLGPGIELESHHNFAVLRFGTEYVIPMKKNWAVAPVLTFDHKNHYTSWEIALAIGKKF
jgi:hypothetical protein